MEEFQSFYVNGAQQYKTVSPHSDQHITFQYFIHFICRSWVAAVEDEAASGTAKDSRE